MRAFLTVGTQLPFDRLVKMVDLSVNPLRLSCFAQIGLSNYTPVHVAYTDFCSRDEFIEQVKMCDLIISHAGMGSVLTASKFRKPIILMARNSELGEHRNDHQVASARELKSKPNVYVVENNVEFGEAINEILINGWLSSDERGNGFALEIGKILSEFGL